MNQPNKTHQDAQFPQAPYPMYPYTADDEISLVDLAKILVKQRLWFMGVTALIILATFLYALTMTPSYRYVSIYQVAEGEPDEALTNIKGTLEVINNLHVPTFTRNYKLENQVNNLPFKLNANNPESTTLIVMTSEGSADQLPSIASLHEFVMTSISDQQKQLVSLRIASVERQLASTQSQLNEVRDSISQNAAEVAVPLLNRISELENEREQIRAGQVIQLAEKTERASRVGKSLILALGIVLGGILGLISAFMAEFIGRVRKSLVEDSVSLTE